MQLSTVLVSSDSNPLYIDFFPLVHRVWQELVGVRTVLALVAENIPESLHPYASDVILFPPLVGVSDALQSQCIRLSAPQLIATDGAVMVSDIDILPMNASYFRRPTEQAMRNQFIVYRNGLLDHERQVAICYNAAHPEVWAELIGEEISTVEDAQAVVIRWIAEIEKTTGQGVAGWTTDQELLFNFSSRLPNETVLRFYDRELAFTRLDRSDMPTGQPTTSQLLLARLGLYCDYHMLRPYKSAESANEAIANAVLQQLPAPKTARRLVRNVTRYANGIRRRLTTRSWR